MIKVLEIAMVHLGFMGKDFIIFYSFVVIFVFS